MNKKYHSSCVILKEIKGVLKKIENEDYKKIFELIKNSERIFVSGQGRSGLVGKMFAMRLFHLGFETYVIGETITPAINKRDLLVACSGSGETGKTVVDAETAKNVDAKVLLFTVNINSTLAEMADHMLIFSLGGKNKSSSGSVQFGGSLFEQSLLIFFDSLVLYIKKQLDISDREMGEIHTNLE
ncbi:MAG: 6-phospho-3-hexuloisomerase [Bacillota bacterium]